MDIAKILAKYAEDMTWIDIDAILEDLWQRGTLTRDKYSEKIAEKQLSRKVIEAHIYEYYVDVMIAFSGNFVHYIIIRRCYICKKSCLQREKVLSIPYLNVYEKGDMEDLLHDCAWVS